MIKAVLVVVLWLICASHAAAQDRVIGLLSLPEVFGAGQCALFEPEPVALHASPKDGTPIALIRVDQNWSFAPQGGCDGLKVSIHQGRERHELPTLEFDYERPGAIVLEQQNRWFKVRLESGSGWIAASVIDRFMPLSELFEEFVGVTHLTGAFGGPLVAAPGRPPGPAGPRVTANHPVRVVEVRSVFGQAWVEVEVMNHSICHAANEGPPVVIATGWLPLHATSGEPTVWFSSRGC